MSIRTFTKSLFDTSLPAMIVYFSILFIGGCLARAEKKSPNSTASANLSASIPADRDYSTIPGTLLLTKTK